MTGRFEEIMELWTAGKFFDAIKCFRQLSQEDPLRQEEIGSFKQNLATFWKLVEVECQENVEVIFNLWEMVKRVRNWNDETLCKVLRISERDIEDIKNRHKPSSESVGLKMLYELFPQMAV